MINLVKLHEIFSIENKFKKMYNLNMKRKRIRKHYITYYFVKFLVSIINFFTYHFKSKEKIKIDYKRPSIIICNHQTDFDPLFIWLKSTKPFFILATDNIFSGKLKGKFLANLCHVIPKKKGISDFGATMKMYEAINNGYSIVLFPEGNRFYAEFQYYIGDELIKLIKKFKTNLIIYNFHGGTGVSPRFAGKNRIGPFTGNIKKKLAFEEMEQLSGEELLKIIKDDLRVFDSENGYEYKSNKRAEYLERMFFVCPKCNHNHLKSQGNLISCLDCGLKLEYTTHLKLKNINDDFNISMLEWWNYQKEYIKNLDISNKIIFSDDNVILKMANPFKKAKILAKGHISITKDYLMVEDIKFNISDIVISSAISGTKFGFSTSNDSYIVKGSKDFNPLKYVFLFNKLDTKMRINKLDKYYTLEKDI